MGDIGMIVDMKAQGGRTRISARVLYNLNMMDTVQPGRGGGL